MVDPLAQLGAAFATSEVAFAAFAARTAGKRFATGDWLLRAGDRAEWCYFIATGLVRELYITADGVEHTRAFLAEGQLTGSLLDLLSDRPSVTWIQALEAVDAIAWRYRDLDGLCARFPELHAVARRAAEQLALRKVRREYELLALSAAERRARWLSDQPALDRRVSRRHLASYLGVTPEHLSRLRSGRKPAPRAAARPRSR